MPLMSLVMKKGCPKTVKVNKKKCELLREDGAVIEAGENDTLIINKLVGEPKNYFGILGFSYYDSIQRQSKSSLQ
jgi:phosphate transport system substrate-binding protein